MLAHDERQGAIDDMRARFRAVSEQIANELAALARTAPQLPAAERTAVLSAAAQIAKTQEGLCAETARAPIALELSLGVMQDLLEGLLHLGGIVKQQAPSGLDPELIARSQIARSQIALLTRAKQEQQERVAAGLLTRLTQDLHRSDDADALVSQALADAQIPGKGSVPAGSHRQIKSDARARESALTLGKTAVSLALSVVAAFGGGLLVNYANLSSGSAQPESATKRLELPRPSMVAATPLPVPSADTPASTEPSPWVTPAPPPSPSAGASMEPSLSAQGPRTQLSPLPQSADAGARPSTIFSRTPAETITTAAIAPRPAPSPAEVRAGGPAGREQFVPVVFTHKDQAAAAQAFADLQHQYPTLLKRRQSQVQPVEIDNKGTWHRLVVLPAGSRQQAGALCAQLTAAGYDHCWVKAY